MPAKRKIKKLSQKVKDNIRENYSRLKKSDYQGEALAYLNRVKGAAKARKIVRDRVAKIDDLVIPKDSEIYEIISKAAKIKKMSIRQFIKKHREAIEAFMKEGDIVNQRETEYLIEDIQHLKPGKKVYVNDGNGYVQTGKKTDILHIQVFTQHVFQHTDIFMIIYRVHYKLNGDLTHYLPPPNEYEELEEPQDIEALLDSFYPEITYLKSVKGNAKKERPKRIKPYSRKRKNSSKFKHGVKRARDNKVSKKR